MPKNRREALKKLAAGSLAVGSLAMLAPTEALAKKAKTITDCDCADPNAGPMAAYFTNAIVQTHRNRKALFYQDLLKDKVVMINFMSTATEEIYQSTQRLLAVQDLLGERLGRDFHLYSITIDPAYDQVSRLKDFADIMGVRQGWSFITGSQEVIDGIKARFFFHEGHMHSDFQHKQGNDKDCSMGLMRYGNAATGTWGSVPHNLPADWIIKRLDWVRSGKTVSAKPKRRGPSAHIQGKPWLYDSGNYSS